ncbi:MAG: DUF3293 domain-containing protein [Thermomicrobiales bacterium]
MASSSPPTIRAASRRRTRSTPPPTSACATCSPRGLAALPHIGRSPDGTWTEHGFFVLDLAVADALDFAADFEQFAIVLAERGKPAELVLTAVGQQRA